MTWFLYAVLALLFVQSPQASKPQSAEARDAEDKVQAALAKQEPNTLLVGNDQGEIIAKYDTKELRKKGYKSLSDFLKKTRPKECKKISTKCRKCPDGKIYCTNDTPFASGEDRDANP